MKAAVKKLTLDDLSSHLQLSKFSISRALGGKKGVSSSTRAVVLEAARKLGYEHPGLSGGQPYDRQQIQLVIPRQDAIDNPAWIEVMSGAEEAAKALGCTLTTAFADAAPAKTPPGTRGILLAGRRSRGLLESYIGSEIPVVLVGYSRPGEHIDTVHVADWEGGYLMGQHLKGLGHERIAFVTDAPEDTGRSERFRGCRSAYGAKGEESVIEVLFDPEQERDPGTLYRRVLEKIPEPTAIICASESVCFNALMALSAAGIKVPGDISVVTSNSTLRRSQIGFDVTALHQPMHEIGALAVELLGQRMTPGVTDPSPRRLSLCPDLLIKGTSAAARKIEARQVAALSAR